MLNNQDFKVVVEKQGPLTITNFLKPKITGLDTYSFQFTGLADHKFLTKLAKLIEAETKEKDGQKQNTKQHQ